MTSHRLGMSGRERGEQDRGWRTGWKSRSRARKPSAIITPGSLALWPEHLLAVNLVVRDCLLALVRNKPVDELLAKLLLHMRMLGRVHQYDAVLVEQPFIALHLDDEVGLVLKSDPRPAVRQQIGPAGCCHVKRGTHALSNRFVPTSCLLPDVDTSSMPEIDFRNMRAGVVAARDEGCNL